MQSPIDRLEGTSVPEPNSGCWLWLGSTRNGYGRLMIGSRKNGSRKSVSAHRYSYEQHIGPIPEGLYVCHRCDVRSCVNPDHLFLGTHQDNIDDRERKGRNRPPAGELNGRAKLTEFDVRWARAHVGRIPLRRMAAICGVDKHTLSDAIQGNTWTHVLPDPPKEGETG